jgi:hypothetical protein
MLGVKQQPVEPRSSAQLGTSGVRQSNPETDLRFAFLNGMLKAISRNIH